MTRAIGVTIAGAGNAGLEHLRAFAAHPGAQVASMVETDIGRAKSAQHEVGIECPVFDSLERALANDDVDAVVIATPNALHPAMTETAARAGKHILLEKPAALDAAALDGMVDAVAAAGVLCQVNMILRWHPMIRSIVELRDRGDLGEIHTVEAEFIFGELEGVEPDWARTKENGGSLHLYAGCHPYDQLEWLMQDRAIEVSAVSARRSSSWQYDVTSTSIFRFSQGGLGRATVTLEAAAPYRFGVRVFGTAGTVVDNTVCIPDKHDGSYVEHCKERVDVTYLPFDLVADDFVRNVATGSDSHASLAHTADLFRLALDVERAAQERRLVQR